MRVVEEGFRGLMEVMASSLAVQRRDRADCPRRILGFVIRCSAYYILGVTSFAIQHCICTVLLCPHSGQPTWEVRSELALLFIR